jgi:hypothetical protein
MLQRDALMILPHRAPTDAGIETLLISLTSRIVGVSSVSKNCRVSIISSLMMMRSWKSEIPSHRSDDFNPDSGRLHMALSRTWWKAPAESALVTNMMDGFVGLRKEAGRRVNPNRKSDVVRVAVTPISGVNPFESLRALHKLPPIYWVPSTAARSAKQERQLISG